MVTSDVFVGSLSILLGAIALSAAALNSQAIFHLPIAQSMERSWGRIGARIFLAVLGAALVVAGSAVIAGFAPGWLGVPFLDALIAANRNVPG